MNRNEPRFNTTIVCGTDRTRCGPTLLFVSVDKESTVKSTLTFRVSWKMQFMNGADLVVADDRFGISPSTSIHNLTICLTALRGYVDCSSTLDISQVPLE